MLPSSLTPVSDEKSQRLVITARFCDCCREPLPIGKFSRRVVRGTVYHARVCNRCRITKQDLRPASLDKKELVAKAKARPCTVCGGVFNPAAMHLVHVRGEQLLTASTAWHWAAKDRLVAELNNCEPVCANCRQIHAKAGKHPFLSLLRAAALNIAVIASGAPIV